MLFCYGQHTIQLFFERVLIRFKRVFPLYLCSYPLVQRKARDGLKNRQFLVLINKAVKL